MRLAKNLRSKWAQLIIRNNYQRVNKEGKKNLINAKYQDMLKKLQNNPSETTRLQTEKIKKNKTSF